MTGQEEYPRFISNRPCGNDKYEGKSQPRRAGDFTNKNLTGNRRSFIFAHGTLLNSWLPIDWQE